MIAQAIIILFSVAFGYCLARLNQGQAPKPGFFSAKPRPNRPKKPLQVFSPHEQALDQERQKEHNLHKEYKNKAL